MRLRHDAVVTPLVLGTCVPAAIAVHMPKVPGLAGSDPPAAAGAGNDAGSHLARPALS
jgi:hypothetical protein